MTLGVRETEYVRDLLSRSNFPVAGPVACAVSGGPDSMALLVLAAAAGLTPTAHHVDHGLLERREPVVVGPRRGLRRGRVHRRSMSVA